VNKENIQKLIEEVKQGKEYAFKVLMERYQPGIYKMIYQIIKNREETEDIVQETFIKAFNSINSYNNKYAFSTWLYKIAYNHSIDTIRKRKLKTFSIDKPIKFQKGEIKQEIRDESFIPDKEIMNRESINNILKQIESLPEKYRKALVLRHQEDYSYEEISKMLSIPIGTVKARIFRAREILKKKLQE